MKQEIIRIDLSGVNCYLGKENDNFILFDTGGHLFFDKKFNNRREAVEKELERHGCNTNNLRLIVLTHGDNDHVANASYFRKKYNTNIAMHPADEILVNNPEIENLMENCHYHSVLFKVVFLFMKRLIKKIVIKTLEDYDSFRPDILIDEGFDLSEFGFHAKVIHIPGHTRGSIGIITEMGDLISGDTFANTGKLEIAPNAYNFKELIKSIKRIKSLNRKTIYPGHGDPFNSALLNNLK
ncbi:MBL fold metallo-hydrolase [Anaerocolumna sedimenticola]|uniref:MBL fold metallo-hydrolase n=1 Tax=Anaerocolumna sedimenticola TaxID=2696063 RepID=A0A6P1TL66_9FIRM|nr:MBL fold metallo-hydrolase [Anaerocolumna sedimenticola]QHQ60761.1 MBL fold metallo-hydrolase [Anaerocolumna sedimenticola]